MRLIVLFLLSYFFLIISCSTSSRETKHEFSEQEKELCDSCNYNDSTKKMISGKLIRSRMGFEKLGTNYEKAEKVITEKEIIENINCYWLYTNETKSKDKMIIYLHGGCFALGSINSHQALVSHLAKDLEWPILFIEYGLAPEHPFPYAIQNVLDVYKKILQDRQPQKVAFMGDSAGASLATSVISILNKENNKIPDYLVMISPWLDLSCSNKTIVENAAIDPILTKETLEDFASLYIGTNSLPDVNPIETIFGKFPATLILTGSNEILLDDSKLIQQKIAEQQPSVKLSIYDKQTHVWLLDDIHSPSSTKAIEEISRFING